AAQVGKVVNYENLAGGLQCHLLNAADNGFLKIFLQQRVAVKRYTVQPFGKGVEVSVFVGVSELELLVG
ncbi:hypothetical protein, partial [Bifidobacterium longum]|uniref:hypothetical protein n=1 Tax=Bifidobacterium longum TaxID=216816 RepID=UPI001EDE742B